MKNPIPAPAKETIPVPRKYLGFKEWLKKQKEKR